MANANSGIGEPNDIQAQIAQLREQVDALMKENEPQAAVARRARTICGAIRATRQRTEGLSSGIRQQPLLALLIARGIGILLGRALP